MRDFVRAWDKVMMLDRFEVRSQNGEGALQRAPSPFWLCRPERANPRTHRLDHGPRKFSSTTFR